MFYENSQGLVGVHKDVGTNSSRTITLDLSRYDKPESNKENRTKSTKRRAVSEGGAVQQQQAKKRKAVAASPGETIATQ